ncbi:GNAT family N-acetyltransferase [Saccharothrix longispora]|uniref:GNAT family N-acetyltransferase n=1 Tax=Saccharothrix longispora TaxID=33920 RepID=UPI0028FD0342|nr:GNAT family N-acetyltransferase [Saccharothrix longispora]MBY8849447.1 GNAT family N-acetyltransferase [Saccharothrix sp. MB29]MDU0291453.1 GNAT family N-acetyltransferase [Saccharothrix longispora]
MSDVIRRAVPTDLPVLLPLVREFYEVDEHAYDEDVVTSALEPLLRDDRFGQVWLFDTGYAVLTWGYSLESGGRDALLDEFYVRNRGGGVGGAVVAALVERARAAGARKVFLETEDRNEAARRFYRRHGFADEASTWLSLELRTDS